jgi:hypothetical protein
MYSWLKIEFIENLIKFLSLPGWEFSCIDKFYVIYLCLFSIRFNFSYYKFCLILLEVSDFLFLLIFTISRGFWTSCKQPPQIYGGFSPNTSCPWNPPQIIYGNLLVGSFWNPRKTFRGGWISVALVFAGLRSKNWKNENQTFIALGFNSSINRGFWQNNNHTIKHILTHRDS